MMSCGGLLRILLRHLGWEEKVPQLIGNVCHWYGLGDGSMFSALLCHPSSEFWYLFALTMHKGWLAVKTSHYRIVFSQACSGAEIFHYLLLC